MPARAWHSLGVVALRPFRALRPTPEWGCRRGGGALRRRQRRRGAGRWRPATRSASCTSPAPRSTCPPAPIRTPMPSTSGPRANFARLQSAAPLVEEDRAERLLLSAADGRARADRAGGVLLLDEYEQRRHPKHERTRKDKEDDRTRHMRRAAARRPGRCSSTYPATPEIDAIARRVTAGAPLYRLHRRRRRASTRSGASTEARRRGPRRGVRPRARCSTSPTATTARRARRARGRRCGGRSPERRRARPTRSWRSRSRTTRCGSCPTTAW